MADPIDQLLITSVAHPDELAKLKSIEPTLTTTSRKYLSMGILVVLFIVLTLPFVDQLLVTHSWGYIVRIVVFATTVVLLHQ